MPGWEYPRDNEYFGQFNSYYKGHPVDPGSYDYESETKKNSQLADILLREQLKAQGFWVDEPAVAPDTVAELLPEYSELDEAFPDEGGEYGGYDDMFPPMVGYYTSYYANMAFFIPESFNINRNKTTTMWATNPHCKLRYLVLNSTKPGMLSVAGLGTQMSELVDFYYSCDNLSFSNELAVNAIKKPYAWNKILVNDITGFGNKLGTVNIGNNRGLYVISGTEENDYGGEGTIVKTTDETEQNLADHGIDSNVIVEAVKAALNWYNENLSWGSPSKKSKSKKKKKSWWQF